MPELPEVETIRRDLEGYILGQRILEVEVLWPRTVRGMSPGEFRARLVGQRIEALGRRGKHLVLDLSGGERLIIHLMMSGRLLVEERRVFPGKYDRVLFRLEGGLCLRFRDVRKFGWMALVEDTEEFLAHLGPEPLGEGFTEEALAELLNGRRGQLKPLLLDQRFLAGVGNLYADEALFAAGLHPCRRADSLTEEEIDCLWRAIRWALKEGIEDRGSSFTSYRDARGRRGRHQEHLSVYARRGQPCPRCGAPIERMVVGGRGTHFCPNCQREDWI